MKNPFSLKGKNIIVPIFSSDIGSAVALECNKNGANVILVGDDSATVDLLFSKLSGDCNMEFVINDYNDDSLKSFLNDCPKINGISFNVYPSKNILAKFLTRRELNAEVDKNVFTPFLVIKMLFKSKKISEKASVVFLSMISGIKNVHYADSLNSITSGALNAFAKDLALEYSQYGLRVNNINYGVIMTESMMSNSVLTEKELNEKQRYFPLKRFGKPEDIAKGVVFLLSDASSWISGASLIIDGGYSVL